MKRLLSALINIAANLARIREILEIVFKDKLEAYAYYKEISQSKKKRKDGIEEFDAIEIEEDGPEEAGTYPNN